METTYFQLMDVEVNAWAGDYPTLDDALTAVREWADQDGDEIVDSLALCRRQGKFGGLIAEGPALLLLARQPVTATANASSAA